jgi:hypothetical protein
VNQAAIWSIEAFIGSSPGLAQGRGIPPDGNTTMHGDDSKIRVSAPRSDEADGARYSWSYTVMGDDGHTVLESSDGGSFTYETEALALEEGWREAREAQAKRHDRL